MCNLALVNGGSAGLTETTKKCKITVHKSEGVKLVCELSRVARGAQTNIGYWEALADVGDAELQTHRPLSGTVTSSTKWSVPLGRTYRLQI